MSEKLRAIIERINELQLQYECDCIMSVREFAQYHGVSVELMRQLLTINIKD